MNILEKIRKDREDLTKPFAGMIELDEHEITDDELENEDKHLEELDRECIPDYD